MKPLTEMIRQGFGIEDMTQEGHSYEAISNAVDALLVKREITAQQRNDFQALINRYRLAG